MAIKKQIGNFEAFQEKQKFKILNNKELIDFGENLEKFRITKTLSDGKKISHIDYEKFLISVGALNKNGAIIIPESDINRYKGSVVSLNSHILFEEYSEYIRQYGLYKAKIEYAEKMKLKNFS